MLEQLTDLYQMTWEFVPGSYTLSTSDRYTDAKPQGALKTVKHFKKSPQKLRGNQSND